MDISTVTGIYVEGKSAPESMDENAALQKLYDIGFRAADVGLASLEHESYILRGDDWQQKVDKLGETAAKLGMNLFQCHLPFYPTHLPRFRREGFPEYFDECMRRAYIAAGMLGIRWGVVHPRTYPEYNHESKACLEANRAYYDPFVELGIKHNVGTAMENLNPPMDRTLSTRYCQHYDQLIELVDSYHDPMVGICWDTGHANQNHFDQARALRAVGSRLRVLHLNDNHRGIRDEHLAPFMGEIDWQATMEALAEIGYSGALNLETGKVAKFLPKGPFRDAGVRLVFEAGKTLRAIFEQAQARGREN